MEPDALARATEDVRSAGARSALLPPAELLAEWAGLRNRERELLDRALEVTEKGHEDVLAQVRARLGLGEG